MLLSGNWLRQVILGLITQKNVACVLSSSRVPRSSCIPLVGPASSNRKHKACFPFHQFFELLHSTPLSSKARHSVRSPTR